MTTATLEEEQTVKPEIATVNKKGQFTLPMHIRKELELGENDQLEITIEDGRIVLNPVVTISKDQLWFWTKEWQKGEMEAQRDIEAGRVNSFTDVNDAIKFLRD